MVQRKLRDDRVVKRSLLAKPDRLVIGSILRSKTGLSNQCPAARFFGSGCSQHSAECVDIDNESNQVP
jgi:hypothetical protein